MVAPRVLVQDRLAEMINGGILLSLPIALLFLARVATVRTALTPGGLALVVCAERRVRFGSELVQSAFAEEGFDGTVETVTPHALPFLAEAAGYAPGMSFDVHRWPLR